VESNYRSPPTHVANTKTRRHKGRPSIPICPQITQINADSLPRDSTEWRGPDRRRTTPGNRCIGSSLRTRVFVAMARYSGLRSRRAQASPPLISCGCMDRFSLPNRRRARRNRRAPGPSSGGKHGCDERSRSEQTCFSPVVGDRKIADVFAGNPGHCTIRESICVNLRDLRAPCVDGWFCDVFGSLCLRVCDVSGGRRSVRQPRVLTSFSANSSASRR